jgi:hypothetical protein
MNRSRSCPNLQSYLAPGIASNCNIIMKPIPVLETGNYSEICHCKFIKPDHKKVGNKIWNKVFHATIRPNTIVLPISDSSLVSLHKTYIDKCHIMRILKVFYYMPRLNRVALYNNRKFVSWNLSNRDDKYWQNHLFCLSKTSTQLYQYLKDVGYDIDIASQLHQILNGCYHKNYSIIWLDGTILSEIQIIHAIYILRVMYHHTNTIIIMVSDIQQFKKTHDNVDFPVTESNSQEFYKFSYLKYIQFKKLMKEITISSNVNISNESDELIVQSDVSKKNIAKYLNNKFYFGCNTIKADFIPKYRNKYENIK